MSPPLVFSFILTSSVLINKLIFKMLNNKKKKKKEKGIFDLEERKT